MVHLLVMSKGDIQYRPEINVMNVLQFFKYFQVMICNIAEFRQGEVRPAACNVTPGGATPVIQEYRIHTGLAHVTEQSASSDASTGNH